MDTMLSPSFEPPPKKTIAFFYPSDKVGGGELLFIRLANYFSTYTEFEVYYIDQPNGYSVSRLNENVKKIYFDAAKTLNLQKISLLLTTPYNYNYILQKKILPEQKTTLALWVIHPMDFCSYFEFSLSFIKFLKLNSEKTTKLLKFFLRKDYNFTRSLFAELLQKKALYFMDGETKEKTLKTLELTQNLANSRYVPIPVANSVFNPELENYLKKPVSEETINIAWLGRLVDFKIFSLQHLVKECFSESQAEMKNINIHIIGEGDKKSFIEKEMTGNKVHFIFKNTLEGNELSEYLCRNVDILFAMGTSCLEGARLKIPSVLYDFNYRPILSSYKYNWIFQTKNYTLGRKIDELHEENCYSLKNLLDSIYKNNQKKQIGEKCFEYYKNSHTLDSVANKLLSSLIEATATYSDLKKYDSSGFSLLNKILTFYFSLFWRLRTKCN